LSAVSQSSTLKFCILLISLTYSLTLAEQDAERERMQALEVQTQDLLAFVQELGEQQGWQIPAQLLASPRPPPPPRRESTPVSMSTIVLLLVLMLSVKPSFGLRAGFVDLSVFVPELLICRPSCRNVVVGLRVDLLFAGFGNLPMYRRCCRNFQLFSTTWIFILLLTFNFFLFSGTQGRHRTMSEGRQVARRGIPSWSITGIPVVVSCLQTHFYVLHLGT
jgi:hypothetical protein